MNKNSIAKIAVILSSFAFVLAPVASINAVSTGGGGLLASVTDQAQAQITLNSITPITTQAIADGSFESGWRWTFDVTIPSTTETSLMMKFEDWISVGSATFSMPTAGNVRFYSPQSSNSFNASTATTITAANTYSVPITLNGNLINSQTSRRIQIMVETKIPTQTSIAVYSTNFGIKTQ